MFDGILNPSWAVVFGVSFSLALFVVKFVTARSPKFDDVVVGLADIPTVLTASACSLMVVAASRAADWHISGAMLAWLVVIFVMNVWVFRYVEGQKRNLSGAWKSVSLLIALSFATSIVFSLNIVSASYLEQTDAG